MTRARTPKPAATMNATPPRSIADRHLPRALSWGSLPTTRYVDREPRTVAPKKDSRTRPEPSPCVVAVRPEGVKLW